MKKLPRYGRCFICGDENECGTRLTWVQTADGVQGTYRGAEKHCGFEGIMHGGVLAGLLDECVGWAASLEGGRICVTGELNVRYLKPVPLGREILIRGRASGDAAGKKFFPATGEIVDGEGTLYATCEAKFFPMPAALQAMVLEKLELPDGAPGRSLAEHLWSDPRAE